MKWPPLLNRPRRRLRRLEGVLGTALELQLLAGSTPQLSDAERALLAELDRLELIFSRFLPDSELNRLQAGRQPNAPLSPDLAALLSQAQHFMTLTGGAFHPASDTLARLWASGEPEPGQLNRVLEQMRCPLWTLSGNRVTLHSDLGLNFNAHAKGYITDRAALAAFQSPGVREVVLNIGGDVCHIGQRSVPVGIEAPGELADNRAPLLFVNIRNQAVATSGQAHRGRHLFDPRSGQPTAAARTVSVLAPTCAEADALSTAFCVLDPGESLALADSLGNIGVLILDDSQQLSNAFWQHHQSPLTSR